MEAQASPQRDQPCEVANTSGERSRRSAAARAGLGNAASATWANVGAGNAHIGEAAVAGARELLGKTRDVALAGPGGDEMADKGLMGHDVISEGGDFDSSL